MAKDPDKAEATKMPEDVASEEARQECGIIMPISATTSHDASHWADVQELLHRAVRMAELEPKNVWAGSAIDRITPRILSNLFSVPIAVCDISDLNPNVMLELGMRLTSKKPTIVVAENGSQIPFDIRDFEAIFYPGDLSILGMEKFFDELKEQLTSKLTAFNHKQYEPFLKDIAIEFLEPQGRAVPFEKLVESRLDSIVSRIEEMAQGRSSGSKDAQNVQRAARSAPSGTIVVILEGGSLNSREALRAITEKTTLLGSVIDDGTIYIPFGNKPTSATIGRVEKALKDAGISAAISVA